jgi:hypothetical protein
VGKVPQARDGNGHHEEWPVSVAIVVPVAAIAILRLVNRTREAKSARSNRDVSKIRPSFIAHLHVLAHAQRTANVSFGLSSPR